MPLLEKSELLKVLYAYNPWWDQHAVPSAFIKTLHRTAYYETWKLLQKHNFKRAIVLTGPRRVGKTTVLYQIANQLIINGHSPKDILYLTLEHPLLKLTPIDQVLEFYSQTIAGTKETCTILLDELQYIDYPTLWLKILVDRFPGWRIVVTGSASIILKNKDRESGVGRWVEVPVPTLSFFENLLLREQEMDKANVPSFSPDITPTTLEKISPSKQQEILSALSPFQNDLETFLLQGGFPETTLEPDTAVAQRLLREDIIDKVLKRDMPAFYGVRKLEELEKIFVYLCIHTGGTVEVTTIAKELGISRPTAYSLLQALEGTYLVKPITAFEHSGKKVLKSKTKWYVVDASIRNAVLLRHLDLRLNPTEMGLVVETAVINQLATFAYPERAHIGYWKNKQEKEVDLIVGPAKSPPIAVEVKYREDVHLTEKEGIYSYLSKNTDAVGIVVTKQSRDIQTRQAHPKTGVGAKVTLVPAHVFLFLLGHAEYHRNQTSGA